jgi:hypothetical protein
VVLPDFRAPAAPDRAADFPGPSGTATDLHPAPATYEDEPALTEPSIILPKDSISTPLDLRATAPARAANPSPGLIQAGLPGSGAPTGLLQPWEGTLSLPAPAAPATGQRRWYLIACVGFGIAIAVLTPLALKNLDGRSGPGGPLAVLDLPDLAAPPDLGAMAAVADPRPRETPESLDIKRTDHAHHRSGHKERFFSQSPVTPSPIVPGPQALPAPHPATVIGPPVQVQFLVQPSQQKMSISCAGRKPLLVSCSTPNICSAVTAVSPGEECHARLADHQIESFSYDRLKLYPIRGSLQQVELDLSPLRTQATPVSTLPTPQKKIKR